MVEHVIIFVVKGNLKHRLLKLGVELHEDDLTPAQKALRKIAHDQKFQSVPPERPSWAGGACLYLTEAHANQIQDQLKRQGVSLQSKHIVVSPTHQTAVELCLSAKPNRTGREAFLISRAGMVQTETKLFLLPPVIYYTAGRVQTPPGQAASAGSSETSSGGLCPDQAANVCSRGRGCGRFLKVLDHKEIGDAFFSVDVGHIMDEDLLQETFSFVTAPVTVQQCSMTDWKPGDKDNPLDNVIRLWELACFENDDFLILRKTKDLLSRYPFCVACGKRAEASHLNSKTHRDNVVAKKRRDHGIGANQKVEAHGKLLTEMLLKEVPAGSDLVSISQKLTPTTCATEGCDRPAGGRLSGSENYCCMECKFFHTQLLNGFLKKEDEEKPRKHDCRCAKNFVPIKRVAMTHAERCNVGADTGCRKEPPGLFLNCQGHPGTRYWGQPPPAPPPLPAYLQFNVQLQ